jgi:hypothetical protein
MDEPQDPTLQGLRTLWDAPQPSPELARRVFAAYSREFGQAPGWRRWLKVRVRLSIAASLASMLIFALFISLRFHGRATDRSTVLQTPRGVRYKLVTQPRFIDVSQGEHP